MSRNNQINYIEFQAPELKPIKDFYAKTFEWKFADYGTDYCAFSDGIFNGGFAKGAKRGGAPLVILYADNLEESLEAVMRNGGTIKEQIYTFPGGRRFHFVDPAGNELAVWSEK